MRKQLFIISLLLWANISFAQIGYQVSLLNSATGQPRAGETVTVDIKLTNCENTTVYTTQQKATSNDFGVLSLSVGDAKTFDELDWNKLPLYIEVSIDGVLIAKSQVLSVPVAEYAKKSGFVLTKEFLASKTWSTELYPALSYFRSLRFSENGICEYYVEEVGYDSKRTYIGNFYIVNNCVYIIFKLDDEEFSEVFSYVPFENCLIYETDDSGASILR